MDEYLIHTAQSYADAHDLWGYFEFRYGDDDHWQNVDTGKVLAVMGVKNFQGMDIDPNHPPVLPYPDLSADDFTVFAKLVNDGFQSAFVDAVKKYQSSLMAEGMDLTTANEHIMDAFREANTAQINYAK